METILSLINTDTNHHKFYRLLYPEGSAMVLHQWGRIGQWVQEQWVCHDDADAATKDYSKTLAAKLKEGYTHSDWSVMPTNYRKYGRPSKKEVIQLPLFEGDL